MDLTSDLFQYFLREAAEKCKPRRDVIDHSFQKQKDFIEDPVKRKVLWCTRRSAKSYTAGLYLHKTAEDFPNSNSLYLGLTRASAKGIIWKDILLEIDKKHNLQTTQNKSELTLTAQNGSMIHIAGVDSMDGAMFKQLGKKWKLVIIDESQSYGIDLRALVYGVLGPAMIDQGGTICLLGTAGNITQGLFFDITNGLEPGWSLHQWTAHDNPYIAKQWKEELDDIAINRPKFMETALFKQWYRNQWQIDADALVYKYNRDYNFCGGIPGEITGWRYVLGIDLGHSPDPTAFVVGCYDSSLRQLYIVYAYKKTHLDLTDVANHIKELDKKYNFDVKIVDGSAKQAVAELNNRHGTNLIAADKAGKSDFINLMNADFIQGHIKILPAAEILIEEYKKLVWECDLNGRIKEPRKEDSALSNHLTDAALYLWRHCYSYLYSEILPFKDKSQQEIWEGDHISRLQAEVKADQNPSHLDLAWNADWDTQNEEFS